MLKPEMIDRATILCSVKCVVSAMKKTVIIASCLGVGVPLIWLSVLSLFPLCYSDLILWMWPCSIFLMATDGIEGTATAWEIVAISVGINVLLYEVLGVALFFLLRKLRGSPINLGKYAGKKWVSVVLLVGLPMLMVWIFNLIFNDHHRALCPCPKLESK